MRVISFVAGLAALFAAAAAPAQEQAPAPTVQEQAAPPPPEQAAPPVPDETPPAAPVEAEVPTQDEVVAPAAAPAPEQTAAPAGPTAYELSVTPPLEPENSWHLDLSNGGRVTVQLRPDAAPAHVERIKALTRQGFYDGLTFHRVIEGFMAQGGDPTGTGAGGSDLANLPAERRLPHLRGAVAMARTEAEASGDAQFYIMLVARLAMDDDYSVFGRVVGGMNFVDTIERGEPPPNPTRIVRASIGSDNVPQLSAEELRAAGERLAQAARPAAGGTIAVGPVMPPPPVAANTERRPVDPRPVPRRPQQ